MSDKLARDLERYADLVEDCALISPEEMNCASVMRLSAEALLSKTVEHWSDCAVHSEPAYPKGECDCGGYKPEQEPVATPQEIYNKICLGLAEAGCKLSEQQKMAFASLIQDAAPLQPKKPEHAPYGYLKLNTGKFVNEVEGLNPMKDKRYLPLYTTQPQRTWVGLTDEDYQILREGVVKQGKPLHWMIEHIEAKLKEKNT